MSNLPIPFATTPLPAGAPALLRSLYDGIVEAAARQGFASPLRPDGLAACAADGIRLMPFGVSTPSKPDVGLALELEGTRPVPFRFRLIVHPNDGRCFTSAEGLDPHAVIPDIPKGHPRPPALRYYAPGSAPGIAALVLAAAKRLAASAAVAA